MINIQSLENKTIDLKNDIYATKADHICVVETWLDPKRETNFLMKGHLLMLLVEEVKVVPCFLCKLEKCHKKEQ